MANWIERRKLKKGIKKEGQAVKLAPSSFKEIILPNKDLPYPQGYTPLLELTAKVFRV